MSAPLASATLSVQVPWLVTERLILREPRMDDFRALGEVSASTRHVYLSAGSGDDVTLFRDFCTSVGHWIARGIGYWTIERRDGGAVVGRVGVVHPEGWPDPDLGWQIFPGHRSQGFAEEAAAAVVAYAFTTLAMPSLVSLIPTDDLRWQKVATRVGAVAREEITLGGRAYLVFHHQRPEASSS